MDKPIGTYLVLWPAYWALWIAAEGIPDLKLLFIFTLGAFLTRSAGCAINDFADRKVDGHVKRTTQRPIPSGRVSPREAVVVFSTMMLLAFVLVLFTNLPTILLSFGALALAAMYPFMKRYTKSQLAKKPHLKGKDLETTKRSCEKFKYKPVSVMNFIEGTRFTPEKHSKQNSPFEGLLKPKSGGIGFVLTVMGEQLHKVVDVTIYYPQKIPTFWHFLSGRVKEVYMHIDVHDITHDLIGDYANDKEYKKRLHSWVNHIWQAKQQTLSQLEQKAQTVK